MQFIATVLAIFIIGYGIYIVFIKPAAAIGRGIKEAVEQDKNVGNKEWEKAHRAETMQRFWNYNNSPITLAVRPGHMTTLAYSREMSSLPVPDSAGGWDIQVTVKNKGQKTIKYITIPFTPYNTVGDRAYSSIGSRSTVNCNITGPIDPGKAQSFVFEKLWYNIALGWIETETIQITFMDGTSYVWRSGLDEYFGNSTPAVVKPVSNATDNNHKWVCNVCKANNANEATKCSICGATRPGLKQKDTEKKEVSSVSTDKNMEAIAKLKELMDMGVISQSEFEEKKQKLIGEEKKEPEKLKPVSDTVHHSLEPETNTVKTESEQTDIQYDPWVVKRVFSEIKDLDDMDKRSYLADALVDDKISEEEYNKLLEILEL